ncbi:methyl-accepting chemotaxis (MCP) signaling domain protein, partial [Vibrio parahaemolyticus V-223/04]
CLRFKALQSKPTCSLSMRPSKQHARVNKDADLPW